MASELGNFFILSRADDNSVYFIQSRCLPAFDGADCMQRGYTLDFVHRCSEVFFKEMTDPIWHSCNDKQFFAGYLNTIQEEILKRAILQ